MQCTLTIVDAQYTSDDRDTVRFSVYITSGDATMLVRGWRWYPSNDNVYCPSVRYGRSWYPIVKCSPEMIDTLTAQLRKLDIAPADFKPSKDAPWKNSRAASPSPDSLGFVPSPDVPWAKFRSPSRDPYTEAQNVLSAITSDILSAQSQMPQRKRR